MSVSYLYILVLLLLLFTNVSSFNGEFIAFVSNTVVTLSYSRSQM